MNPLRWRKMTWLINVVNVLMVLWIVSAISERASKECPPADTLCQDASDLGTTIGVGLIFVIWAILLPILLVIWFATRPSRRLCPACGKDVKKGRTACPDCGHDFAAAAQRQVDPDGTV